MESPKWNHDTHCRQIYCDNRNHRANQFHGWDKVIDTPHSKPHDAHPDSWITTFTQLPRRKTQPRRAWAQDSPPRGATSPCVYPVIRLMKNTSFSFSIIPFTFHTLTLSILLCSLSHQQHGESMMSILVCWLLQHHRGEIFSTNYIFDSLMQSWKPSLNRYIRVLKKYI
jgi:hypothetical protein